MSRRLENIELPSKKSDFSVPSVAGSRPQVSVKLRLSFKTNLKVWFYFQILLSFRSRSRSPFEHNIRLGAPPNADWPWLAYDETMPMVRSYLAMVHSDMPARTALVAGSLTLLRDAAIAGAGVTVLPDYLCREAIEDGSLVLVDPNADLPVNRIFLVWRKSALRQPRVVFVRDKCRAELMG